MRFLLIALLLAGSGAWLHACPNCGPHRGADQKVTEQDGDKEEKEVEKAVLSKEEIEKRLKQQLAAEWDEVELKDAVKMIAASIKVEIKFAKGVLDDDYVTASFAETDAATVLRTILAFFELKYEIKDGKIIIIDPEAPVEKED